MYNLCFFELLDRNYCNVSKKVSKFIALESKSGYVLYKVNIRFYNLRFKCYPLGLFLDKHNYDLVSYTSFKTVLILYDFLLDYELTVYPIFCFIRNRNLFYFFPVIYGELFLSTKRDMFFYVYNVLFFFFNFLFQKFSIFRHKNINDINAN